MFKTIRSQILLLIIVAFLTALYVQWPILRNYYHYDGDTAPVIYWINSLALDKYALNSNDLMSVYASWYITEGVKFVYFIGSYIIDPIVLAKIIPLLIFTLCSVLMYLSGRLINGNRCGWVSAISFICVSWFYRYRQIFGSADAEEFSIFFMLLFIYLFLKKRYIFSLNVLFLQALFYPPLFILSSLSIILFVAIQILQKKTYGIYKNKALAVYLIFMVSAGMFFLYSKYKIFQPVFLGKTFSVAEFKELDLGLLGGRADMFSEPDTVYSRILSDRTGIGLDLPKKVMFVFALLIIISQTVSKKIFAAGCCFGLPPFLWVFLASGVILAVISNFIMFHFYEPSRFIQNPLNIFLILFISNSIASFDINFRLSPVLDYLPFFTLIYLTILISLCLPRFACHKESVLAYKEAIKFISLLPENSFIVGEPKFMTGIGMYSRKRIFLAYKIASDLLWVNYYNSVRMRTTDFCHAYYSDESLKISNFCKRYGLTHFILRGRKWRSSYGSIVYDDNDVQVIDCIGVTVK